MFDYNEQQVFGEEPQSESEKADPHAKKDAAASSASESCGSGQSGSFDSCPCGGEYENENEYGYAGAESSAHSSNLDFPQSSTPYTETVFSEHEHGGFAPIASDINAPQREALWKSLVASQQPDAASAPMHDVHEMASSKAMQWTLVDLSSGSCDKPGCDPASCDSEDCDSTDAYNRSEYEAPEYASSGYTASLAFHDEPSPAPTAFVPTAEEVPQTAAKSKKMTAAAAKAPKAAKAKKAKTTKAGGKKAAAKKPAAKKTVKKAGAKKATAKKATAKKATTTRAKKGAKTSLPLNPSGDPNFPRVQAA